MLSITRLVVLVCSMHIALIIISALALSLGSGGGEFPFCSYVWLYVNDWCRLFFSFLLFFSKTRMSNRCNSVRISHSFIGRLLLFDPEIEPYTWKRARSNPSSLFRPMDCWVQLGYVLDPTLFLFFSKLYWFDFFCQMSRRVLYPHSKNSRREARFWLCLARRHEHPRTSPVLIFCLVRCVSFSLPVANNTSTNQFNTACLLPFVYPFYYRNGSTTCLGTQSERPATERSVDVFEVETLPPFPSPSPLPLVYIDPSSGRWSYTQPDHQPAKPEPAALAPPPVNPFKQASCDPFFDINLYDVGKLPDGSSSGAEEVEWPKIGRFSSRV